MKRQVISLLVTILAVIITSYGQTTVRPIVKKIAKKLAVRNSLESEFISIGGTPSEQWALYEKLKDKATEKELKMLIEDTNAIVRCYSFQALADRKEADIFPILLAHLSDTAAVQGINGCTGFEETVGDYFLEIVYPQYGQGAYPLSTNQRATLDSILLFDNAIRLAMKYAILSDLPPKPVYYDRVREIVTVEKRLEALVALAKFQNKQDIRIIIDYFEKGKTEYHSLYYAICASIEFPDSSFYPYLIAAFEEEWTKKIHHLLLPKLYIAMARYPTQRTFDLFDKTAQLKNDFDYQSLGAYLVTAVTLYPDPIFYSLKDKIKLDERHLERVKLEVEMTLLNKGSR